MGHNHHAPIMVFPSELDNTDKVRLCHVSACPDRSTVGTGPTSKNGILENLGISYSEWVERCYKERMKQILADPVEFGNLLM